MGLDRPAASGIEAGASKVNVCAYIPAAIPVRGARSSGKRVALVIGTSCSNFHVARAIFITLEIRHSRARFGNFLVLITAHAGEFD